jgi:hypothetical protein
MESICEDTSPSYECHLERGQITANPAPSPQTGRVLSIIFHGGKPLVGIALLTANFYFWAMVWDRVVGPMLPSRFPSGK